MRSATVQRLLSTTFRVGKRYRCHMRFIDAGLAAEWEPEPPTKLTPAEMADYRRGRNAFIAEIAKLIGSDVLLVE
jgi:hypothetical protein